MFQLRTYQAESINSVGHQFKNYKRGLLQSPTGSGKTGMAAEMLARAYKKQTQSMFICHRNELLDQTALTFDKHGLDYGFIASGRHPNYSQKIQIASIDTLKNRLDEVPVPGFIIWDEAHHLKAKGWLDTQTYYYDSYHLGLSATPQRLDGRPLRGPFEFLIPGKPVRWLIDYGYLADYILYSVPGVHRENLKASMGNYTTASLNNEMGGRVITGNILQHWKQHAENRLTIGFAASRELSKQYAAEFTAAGIKSVHIDGETNKAERRQLLREFAMGHIRVVWNVGLFGEGFDVAANSGMDVTVGCVIDAAPTKSLSAWLQRCGRALRPQKKPAIILDHSDNLNEHGYPCEERVWTLDGVEPRVADEPSMTQCKKCLGSYKVSTRCPHCGHKNPPRPRKFKYSSHELEIKTPMEAEEKPFVEDPEKIAAKEKRIQQGQAETEQELLNLGYSNGRANHILQARKDKEELQQKLYHYMIIAKEYGFETELDFNDIKKLKPKKLKEAIAAIKLLTETVEEQRRTIL